MPCMGPGYLSDEQIESISNEVLEFLKEKYQIWNDHFFVSNQDLEDRSKCMTKLNDAIRAIMNEDANENF